MKKRFLFFLFMLLLHVLPSGVFAADKIEINTASLQQLDALTGIGPKYAQAIIDARPFFSVDDLLKVKGIGEKTLQKIKDQGLAYVEERAQPTIQPVAPSDGATSQILTLIPTPIPAVAITYPAGIIISELMPAPEGADETEEYIKIYNKNSFDVDLTGWKIKDAVGDSATYIFPEIKIAAKKYLVLMRTDTKITLNNGGDKIMLFNPINRIIDSAEYEKAPTGQSYKITGAGWQWEGDLTNVQKNNINKGKVSEATNKETLLADLNKSVSFDNKNFLYLILTAAVISLISAITMIFLKRKLTK